MALQLPHRTHLRRTAIAAVLGAALISPATAPAAKAKRPKAKPAPSVSSVRPMQLSVGELLEIRGRNFLRGRNKNTVVFQREGAKAVFVKAEIGTRKLIRVRIPEKLAAFLVTRDGAPAPTRFRIRILSARFGKRFTKDAGSPTNHEGDYIEEIHRAPDLADALLLNPGAWTHYAWSIRDAVEIAGLPAAEVHLSDVQAREPFRRVSVLTDVCVATVSGQGVEGYRSALARLREVLA